MKKHVSCLIPCNWNYRGSGIKVNYLIIPIVRKENDAFLYHLCDLIVDLKIATSDKLINITMQSAMIEIHCIKTDYLMRTISLKPLS